MLPTGFAWLSALASPRTVFPTPRFLVTFRAPKRLRGFVRTSEDSTSDHKIWAHVAANQRG